MICGLVARMRSLWRGIRGHAGVDREMTEEFRLHMELRAADLVRSGVTPAKASRQARLEFGSTERYKDEGRESRGLVPVDRVRVSWLDFKLGFRMLVKYPGLTIVGGLAMAFAIWVGAATFELVTQVLDPTLPVSGGDRIVGLRNWNSERSRPERRVLHDFVAWREQLETVDDLGAFRSVQRNLITGEGEGEPIEVVEISASAFRVTRVPPLLGRALVDEDERPGAPPVVVIGHELWQHRFDGDSAVIGRTVLLGRSASTIVGVMPEGYAFPIAHNFWVPLRLDALDYRRREGPGIQMFGRLAPGVSLDEAQAELTAIGRRTAADYPDTHEHLRPQVMPYAKSIVDLSGVRLAGVISLNVPVLMLLVLICSNVALLMFARAATRETEMAVRNALGASRGRIIMQLFAEALVLGTLAAVVGLAAAGIGLRWVIDVIQGELLEGTRLPFWFRPTLSPLTLLYAAILTVFGAVIAGVVPALKVTRGMGVRLQQASAGSGGLRFGGIWTAVIVAQVAVTVAFPVVAYFTRHDAVQLRTIEAPFPAREFLAVRVEMDASEQGYRNAVVGGLDIRDVPGRPVDTSRAALAERFRTTYAELEQRLEADPAVAGVTFADRLPRMYHPHRIIEIDAGGAAPRDPDYPDGYRVSSASVDPDYFDVLRTPILAGRRFHSGDVGAGARTVIVNQAFARQVLGARSPIGRRFRYIYLEEADIPRAEQEPSEWYEIVGVVNNLGMAESNDAKVAGIYHAAEPGDIQPFHMAVHVKGDPEAFVPRLRAIATATDPTLRLYDVVPLDEVNLTELEFITFWFRILVMVSAVALALSLAGIYAVMAFTVARRTREIGIRIALGASRRRVVVAVFRRPFMQVALGILAGVALLTALTFAGTGELVSARSLRIFATIVAYGVVMMGVCMLACIVPTRRALRVQPTEALRSDG